LSRKSDGDIGFGPGLLEDFISSLQEPSLPEIEKTKRKECRKKPERER